MGSTHHVVSVYQFQERTSYVVSRFVQNIEITLNRSESQATVTHLLIRIQVDQMDLITNYKEKGSKFGMIVEVWTPGSRLEKRWFGERFY